MGKLLKQPSPRPSQTRLRKQQPRKKQTLRELNRLLANEHDELLRKARTNCVKLTGRETL